MGREFEILVFYYGLSLNFWELLFIDGLWDFVYLWEILVLIFEYK